MTLKRCWETPLVKRSKKNLEWTGGEVPKMILTADIVQYEKGDAFKRWLVPGWGATVLVVRGALYESDNRKVGSVDAKRTVDAGGAIPSAHGKPSSEMLRTTSL